MSDSQLSAVFAEVVVERLLRHRIAVVVLAIDKVSVIESRRARLLIGHKLEVSFCVKCRSDSILLLDYLFKISLCAVAYGKGIVVLRQSVETFQRPEQYSLRFGRYLSAEERIGYSVIGNLLRGQNYLPPVKSHTSVIQ